MFLNQNYQTKHHELIQFHAMKALVELKTPTNLDRQKLDRENPRIEIVAAERYLSFPSADRF